MSKSIEQLAKDSETKLRIDLINNKIKHNPTSYLNCSFEAKFYKDMTLEDKIILAKSKIKLFIESLPQGEEIMISFSGGKDSCVLRYIVHEVQKDLGVKDEKKLYYCLTAAEVFHPDTAKFIQQTKRDKDVFLGMIKDFEETIKNDGFPMPSKQLAQKIDHVRNTTNHRTYIRSVFGLDGKTFGKIPKKYIHLLDKDFVDYKISHKCCNNIKGNVKHDSRPVFIGTTIEESRMRKHTWVKNGCILYKNGKPKQCKPLSLWTEKDIWQYIKLKNIPISPIYDKGYTRSGCVCCLFGLSIETELKKHNLIKRNRFELMYDSSKATFDKYMFGNVNMYKCLADLYYKVDITYNKFNTMYKNREREREQWYTNIKTNLSRVLDEIEERNPGVFVKNEKEIIISNYSCHQK